MQFKLRPKNIIVVGGASGIGYSTAQKLLEYGAEGVILASRNVERLKVAQRSLKDQFDLKNIEIIKFDISDVSSHSSILEDSKKFFNCIPDGLVISSGINFGSDNWRGFNISENDWDKVMNINLKGVFFLIRNFANYLHGNNIKGNICVVSSISAHRDLLSVYQVTKNAISGIVHAYGKYLCERGIILNCVEPGTTDTDMMKHLNEYTDGIRGGKIWGDNSIHRLIRPEEIADVVCFLMSNLGEVMSGTCLLAGGGCKTISR